MKHLVRIVIVMALVGTGLWGLGLFLARKFERGEGYPGSDDFRIAAFWGGREFTSTSSELGSGWAVAVLGGIALDLRDARLAAGGATLTLRATAGGIAVAVPEDWRVAVDKTVSAGEVQVGVTEHDELPDDAPVLRIDATTQGGGIVISTKEEAEVPR